MRPLLAVVAPLLVLVAWTSYHALIAKHGVRVELPISGYDPRDLLSGHYLRYQVEYGAPICGDATQVRERCVCLTTPDSGNSKALWHGPCDERPSCDAYLKGVCEHTRFVAGVERFYFPEAQTDLLALVPPKASIQLRLDGRGGAQVEAMQVAGLPLAEWLREQRSRQP